MEKKSVIAILVISTLTQNLCAYSVHRPYDPTLPRITTRWDANPPKVITSDKEAASAIPIEQAPTAQQKMITADKEAASAIPITQELPTPLQEAPVQPPSAVEENTTPVTNQATESRSKKNRRIRKKKETRYETKKTESYEYTVVSSYYEEYPLFKIFNEDYFFEHQLPSSLLAYRNDPTQFIEGKELKQLIEQVRIELAAGKTQFTHFILIHASDYNYSNHSGLVILKFKKYPFVVKIFQERPATILDPHSKGLVPISFHYMAGGANRHILGFSRIRNHELISNRISTVPGLSENISLPRKWFYLPENAGWIEVIGKNVGGKEKISTRFPGTYCIIADFIEKDPNRPLGHADRKNVLISARSLTIISIHISTILCMKKEITN